MVYRLKKIGQTFLEIRREIEIVWMGRVGKGRLGLRLLGGLGCFAMVGIGRL